MMYHRLLFRQSVASEENVHVSNKGDTVYTHVPRARARHMLYNMLRSVQCTVVYTVGIKLAFIFLCQSESSDWRAMFSPKERVDDLLFFCNVLA